MQYLIKYKNKDILIFKKQINATIYMSYYKYEVYYRNNIYYIIYIQIYFDVYIIKKIFNKIMFYIKIYFICLQYNIII